MDAHAPSRRRLAQAGFDQMQRQRFGLAGCHPAALSLETAADWAALLARADEPGLPLPPDTRRLTELIERALTL